MRGKIGELWLQTHIPVSLLYVILCVLNTHNLKTKGCIRTSHLSNYCATIVSIFQVRAVCELRSASYGFKRVSQLFFRSDILCVYILITRKLHAGHIWMFFISNECSTIAEMSIFGARTECKIRLVSYGSKYALQSLFDKPFMGIYTHNLKLHKSYIDVLHIKRLLYYRRHCLCDLELLRDPTGELRPQTLIGRSLIQHLCACVYYTSP